MKPQYKIPMKWEKGVMFTEAIDWTKFGIWLNRAKGNKPAKKVTAARKSTAVRKRRKK